MLIYLQTNNLNNVKFILWDETGFFIGVFYLLEYQYILQQQYLNSNFNSLSN